MMGVSFEKRGPLLGSIDIPIFEKEWSVSLPPDYKSFMQKQNGGIPALNAFHIDARNRSTVEEFFSLADVGLVKQRLKERIPEFLLPIACDSCGNYICLALDSEHYGAVYFWDHEYEHNDGVELNSRDLAKVSDSFGEFLGLLEPFGGMDANCADTQVAEAWLDPELRRQISDE